MIKSKKHLSNLIELPISRIEEIASKVDNFYYEKKEQKFNKDGTPRLHKGDPTFRILNPSRGILKEIQKSIKRRILSEIPLPKNIQGGIKGKDNISNAKLHKGRKYHFVTDIADFFPSISNKLVYEMFVSHKFSPDVSRLLTRLTTYRGKVPQGAPTSTGIANLSFYQIDNELIEFCNANDILYTRFVDDLSFSSQKDFKGLTLKIISIITKHKFRINKKKTHYKIGPVDITGINVKNNCLRPTKEFLARASIEPISEPAKLGRKRYIKRIINEGR